MGLDMYLWRRIYVGANHEPKNVRFRTTKGAIMEIPLDEIELIDFKGESLGVDFTKMSTVVERAGYWRKANAIHKWFVDNVQDGVDECQESYVSREKMEELRHKVNRVLEDNDLAQELLPATSGFFFGGTEYDEFYFEDLEHTKTIIDECLANYNGVYYYQSSW